MQLVVGAAIICNGQVLAARRAQPDPLAGFWELPGGKVEAGEDPVAALVRECREELALAVRPVARVGPDVELANDRRLLIYRCDLAQGEPQLQSEHDAVRWLGPEELTDLTWLASDLVVLPTLRELLLDGLPLPGGRVGGAVRIGPSVRRPSGPWTDTVQALLAHLRESGVGAIPAPLGSDSRSREVVEFLPGLCAAAVDPELAASPEFLGDLGGWLRASHEASRSFPVESAQVWRRGAIAREPGGVICHNDISPNNVIVAMTHPGAAVPTSARLTGVIDWDMAAPGNPLDDVAFAAWQFILKRGASQAAEASGLRLLALAYGVDPAVVLERVVPRLRGALSAMHRGAAAGDAGLQALLLTEIPSATKVGLEALEARQKDLFDRLGQG